MKKISFGKLGQMEMIGLVVIVILITLGMLFMAQFALKEKQDKKIFTRKGLAYSTMSTMMKLGVECEKYDSLLYSQGTVYLELQNDLIQACAEESYGGYPDFYCGDLTPCEYVQKTITSLLNQTLGSWNKHYEFRSTLLSGANPELLFSVIDEDNNGCKKSDRDTSGLFPLNAPGVGLIENVLYLCD